MINLLIVTFSFIISFQIFYGTFQFGGIDRTFYSINRGVIETSIVYDESPLKNTFLYDCEKLKTNVTKYLKHAMKPYTSTFELGFYFYDAVTNEACFSNTCSASRVRLKANLVLFKTYEQALTFELIHNEGNL